MKESINRWRKVKKTLIIKVKGCESFQDIGNISGGVGTETKQ